MIMLKFKHEQWQQSEPRLVPHKSHATQANTSVPRTLSHHHDLHCFGAGPGPTQLRRRRRLELPSDDSSEHASPPLPPPRVAARVQTGRTSMGHFGETSQLLQAKRRWHPNWDLGSMNCCRLQLYLLFIREALRIKETSSPSRWRAQPSPCRRLRSKPGVFHLDRRSQQPCRSTSCHRPAKRP